MLQSQLFNLLCDKADDEYGGRLPVHVRVIADEFANIGQIPQFDKLIATIRSREISASIILQSQSQLKAMYKDSADTILGNCDTTLFLGGKEKTTFNAFCKIVIRHAAIDIILKLRRRWEREVSLDYLMNEKFVQFAEPEQLEEYLFTACGQTAVLYHAELAAALARLPEQTQEKIFRYYFLRQPQRVIGVHIGRTRSTAGRHIQLALKRLRRLMEGKDYE